MKDPVVTCSEELHLIEAGRQPRVEADHLREILARDAGPEQDRAIFHSYKHRLHALRCENNNLRLRIHELEFQINEMRSTRGWKMLEIFRKWRRSVMGCLHFDRKRPHVEPQQ